MEEPAGKLFCAIYPKIEIAYTILETPCFNQYCVIQYYQQHRERMKRKKVQSHWRVTEPKNTKYLRY